LSVTGGEVSRQGAEMLATLPRRRAIELVSEITGKAGAQNNC
jgi:hypothetical protein